MKNLQVTLGSGATPLIAAGQPNQYASFLIVQDNAAAGCRLGGSTVTSTSGVTLTQSGGSASLTLNFPRGALLNNIYLAGTSGNVIDFAWELSD